MGAHNNYARPVNNCRCLGKRCACCANSRATVSLPPVPLAVKGTSAIGQCCQRPEPSPPLDKREDRGCTPGIGPGGEGKKDNASPRARTNKKKQGQARAVGNLWEVSGCAMHTSFQLLWL